MPNFLPSVLSSLFLAAGASAQDWVPLVLDGFGNPKSMSATRIAHFAGADYVGTVEASTFAPGRLLRTTDGVHWSPAAADGFGNPDNIGISVGAVFGGSLYATTSNFATGGELWRSPDGALWTRVVGDGFGHPENVYLFPPVAIGSQLFVATNTFGIGSQLWRSENGTQWNAVISDGYGDPSVYALSGPIALGSALYLGSASDMNPARVFKSLNGTTWTPVGAPGLGDPETTSISPTLVFQGELYANTSDEVGGPPQLWRTHNGAGWTPVTVDGFNNPLNDSVRAQIVHDGWLYVSCGNFAQGAALIRTQDGVHFDSAAPRQFGWPGNFAITGAAVLAGELTATTFNFETGAQLWAMRDQAPLGESFCPPAQNSTGAAAELSAVGPSSLSATGFRLDARRCPRLAAAFFVYGPPEQGTPFRGATLCAGAPLQTIPGDFLTDADGGASCYVAYSEPYAAGITPGGAGIAYQLWFRDTTPFGAGATNALRVVHRP